jgi:hypothetical protein
LQFYGWENEHTYFVHGFDHWDYAKTNHHWGSLRHQLFIKSLYLAAQLIPKWRGFMVSTWKPTEIQSGLS